MAQETISFTAAKTIEEGETPKSQPEVILKEISSPIAIEVPTPKGVQKGETEKTSDIDVSTHAIAEPSTSKDDTGFINELL